MEQQRDHVLGRPDPAGDEADPAILDAALAAAAEQRDETAEQAFEALGSDATFNRMLYDGGEFGTRARAGSDEEADYLGIPGLLEPDQVATLLRRRQAEQRAALRTRKPAGSRGAAPEGKAGAGPTFEQTGTLRRELNALVGAWHHRTGQPHGAINAELRKATGGPPSAMATADELRARIDAIRAWAAARQA
ncbi:MAG TPA: hypothetical protein VK925_10210 [Jiangellaceae bacterium]|nr:hypothetical protein [Jiangellaceae bacterium]